MTSTRHFVCAPASVPQARRFVAEAVSALPIGMVEVAALIVSELATNCVLHAMTDFDVIIDLSDQNLRIAVGDSGGGAPEVQWPPTTESHGRGLQIVEELSDTWGVTPLPNNGKQVWFALNLGKPTVSSAK